MTGLEAGVLIAAAIVGGAQNAIAGGGSFLTFPALVFVGLGSIEANATSTVALWPGALASAFGFRKELRVAGSRPLNLALCGTSFVGGVLGAWLLVMTPESVFDWLVPFLLLLATVLFAFGDRLRRLAGAQSGAVEPRPLRSALWLLPIAIYGGYFGGGIGMMMLALFALLGMSELHRMNGLKSLLSAAINGVALVTFALSGLVRWPEAAMMVVGAIVGGFGGAALSRRIPQKKVRAVVVALGVVLSALFLLRAADR